MRGALIFLAGFSAMSAAGWFAFPKLLYRSQTQPVAFSHKTHTGEKTGMACDDCHSLRDDGRFAGIPVLDKCSGCHTEPMSEKPEEKAFIERYVKSSREVPWLVYSRQPDNVRFSHATHVKLATLKCEQCHGDHGKTDKLRAYEENRISGYSRDIWGKSISRISFKPAARLGMKMDDCAHCHRQKGVLTSCLDCHK